MWKHPALAIYCEAYLKLLYKKYFNINVVQ